MGFSERYGYKPVRQIVQLESIDEILRNGLWSLLKIFCWDHVHRSRGFHAGYNLNASENNDVQVLCQSLWYEYFKKPLDTLSTDWVKVQGELRSYFFQCKWHDVYDFVEFVSRKYNRYGFRDPFISACNALLEKEMSAYRFVNGVVTQITAKEEVAEIEQALNLSPGPVADHIRRALELLSDRNAPDYRNSIKESISAVESLVSLTLKADKGTLGQLIKRLEDKIGLHPALKTAFTSLYGYTSDEGGIRHALTEAAKVDFSDAKFMLVVCSSFINYVEGKLQRAG